MEFDPQKNYTGFSWSQNWFHPPFWWLVNASSYLHDEAYTQGGTKEDRLKADVGFLWRMIQDTNKLPYKQKKRAMRTIILYYFLVRSFGWLAFKKTKSIDQRRADYISKVLSQRHNPEDKEQIIKEATDKFNKSVL